MIRVLVAVFALIFISSSSVFAQQPVASGANKIQLRHSRPANTPAFERWKYPRARRFR